MALRIIAVFEDGRTLHNSRLGVLVGLEMVASERLIYLAGTRHAAPLQCN